VRLKLTSTSRWQVLLAIVLTSARYGRKEAQLSEQDLVEMTGLSRRTVQLSIKDLADLKLIDRAGRYKRFRVNWELVENGGVVVDPLPSAAKEIKTARKVGPPPVWDKKSGSANTAALPKLAQDQQRSATLLAPRKRKDDCASPTVSIVSLFSVLGNGRFSEKQQAVITDVLTEATELLGSDVGGLSMPEELARKMEFSTPITYTAALQATAASTNKAMARDFTKAVLALRQDERVQGIELT
jgi:hypothetical protein